MIDLHGYQILFEEPKAINEDELYKIALKNIIM